MLALYKKRPSPFVSNLDKERNFGIGVFCDDNPPLYGHEAVHYNRDPAVMNSITSQKYKYCCYVFINPAYA